VLDTHRRFWTLSADGRHGLGLCCDQEGLFLGRTPLLDKSDGGFVPRLQADLERLLKCGFAIEVSLDRIMSGLTTVAAALNANDLCRARIAAVHLRIPDLPDAFARIDMQLEDVALSLDRVGKAAAAGDWDPAKHPRAGTAPNPGWFAPTDGSGDEGIQPTLVADEGTSRPSEHPALHLPPGERNDEIGDLLEWIANAKPEDVQGINSEIDRLFYQVGDFQDGNALHSALATVLAHPDDATRQKVLDAYEPITHRDDPGKGADLVTDLATNALFGPAFRFLRPGAEGAVTAEEAAGAEGAAAAEEAASEFWKLGWGARGRAIHDAMGGNLPWWFKGIDDFSGGVATSFKTIDLNAGTYQDASRLGYRINDYVNKLVNFRGAQYQKWEVDEDDITSRALKLVIPKGSMTSGQKAAIDGAIERARLRGIGISITEF
jgi:hypothetical protein